MTNKFKFSFKVTHTTYNDMSKIFCCIDLLSVSDKITKKINCLPIQLSQIQTWFWCSFEFFLTSKTCTQSRNNLICLTCYRNVIAIRGWAKTLLFSWKKFMPRMWLAFSRVQEVFFSRLDEFFFNDLQWFMKKSQHWTFEKMISLSGLLYVQKNTNFI